MFAVVVARSATCHAEVFYWLNHDLVQVVKVVRNSTMGERREG